MIPFSVPTLLVGVVLGMVIIATIFVGLIGLASQSNRSKWDEQ